MNKLFVRLLIVEVATFAACWFMYRLCEAQCIFRYTYHYRFNLFLADLSHFPWVRYEGVVGLFGDIALVALLFGTLYFVKYLVKRRAPRVNGHFARRHFFMRAIFLGAVEDFPWLLRLNKFGKIFSVVLLALHASGMVILTSMVGLINLAIIANSMGAYELGENLLKFGANPTIPLAAQESLCGYLNPTEMTNAVPVVSKLYGPQSIQMAYVYGSFACRDINLEDYSAYNTSYNKALDLCEELNSPNDATHILSKIAESWAAADNKPEAQACIGEALKDSHINRSRLKDLRSTAEKINDQELKKEISARLQKLKDLRRQHRHQFAPFYAAEVSIWLMVIAAAIFGKRWWLNFLNRKWTSILATTTDAAVRMRTLDKLTTLALYRKKLDEAKKYSAELIDLAFAQLR